MASIHVSYLKLAGALHIHVYASIYLKASFKLRGAADNPVEIEEKAFVKYRRFRVCHSELPKAYNFPPLHHTQNCIPGIPADCLISG